MRRELTAVGGFVDLELSLTEISERTGAPHPSVHREIERAEQAGLVTTRKIGNTRLVRANTMRAELDAAFFHLYGINRDDVDYIMETFPIVKRKDEQRHGTYRTKETILKIYDAMTEANATAVPYQTPLSPSPGEGPRHQKR